MTPDQWIDFVGKFGLPMALVLTAILSGKARVWEWAYVGRDALATQKAAYDQVVAVKDDQIAQLKAEKAELWERYKASSDQTLRLAQGLDRATAVQAAAVASGPSLPP